jgi:beta-glucosidase
LGGQAGAGGIVDVLFGDAEPGGRLAESVPEHVAQLPADRNFPGEARQVQYREGPYVGYRFHDTAGVPARFPFGHGLSYTTFDWTDVAIEGTGTDVAVSVTVTNTGSRPGSDVVQLYVRDLESSVRRPLQELRAFAKVHLAAGESERVTLELDRRAFAVWDVAAHDWLVEAGAFELVVARSSADVVAVRRHDVASSDQLAAVAEPAGLVADDDEFVALLGHPVPAVPATRPFHRNSTLEDMEATWLGRRLGAVILQQALREAEREFPDADAATQAMIRAAVREGPARSLVLLSGGKVSFAALDATLAVLNGRPRDAVDVVGAALRSR